MTRLLTKQDREQSRTAQFTYMLNNGWQQIDYKNLTMFVHYTDLCIKTFWGTAANHTDYYRYRTLEQLNKKIESYKQTADSRQRWKEEQQEKKSQNGNKITLATLKKFIKDNSNNLYVNLLSRFDGMTDCVESVKSEFTKIKLNEDNGHNLGVPSLWLVGSSRDYFTKYEDDIYQGIDIYNSCGSCIVAIKKQVEEPQPTQPEIKGKIQIVDYSAKSFAVIGETKIIKDNLKALGGSFNPRLTCGMGWIFPKTKLEAVKAFLIENKAQKTNTQEETQTEPQQEEEAPQIAVNEGDILPTPTNNPFNLESFKIIWHEGRHIENATFTDTTFTTWEEVQRAFYILWLVNEKGQDGGYSKVKCEIKLTGQEADVCRIDITNKFNNGDFNPSCEHITTYLQSMFEPTPATDPTPETHTNLTDINQAAKGGKVISLLNLFELVNQ